MITPDIQARLAKVKILITDVDGVLTDAGVYIGETGEMKRFNVMDGLGHHLLQKSGIKVAWISNRLSKATQVRAEELKVDFLCQSKGSKARLAEEILAKMGFTFADACYVGDDLVDLSLLKCAGVSITVPNAIPEAKETAHVITTARGGHGAFREICELILKAQNKWDQIVKSYSE